MNVASLDFSKELYELSRWDDELALCWFGDERHLKRWVCPKYDLGYLLRKLPLYVEVTYKTQAILCMDRPKSVKYHYRIFYKAPSYGNYYLAEAATPEDAAAKLAIELFKQGVLKKEATGLSDEPPTAKPLASPKAPP